ncbi:unnamed protein product [Arabidopsis lyrata]|nr:unnamed protein product [Arabidopsis lyrata]
MTVWWMADYLIAWPSDAFDDSERFYLEDLSKLKIVKVTIETMVVLASMLNAKISLKVASVSVQDSCISRVTCAGEKKI